MKYSFKFTLFGKKVQMFRERAMGIVIEKESNVVCVYGTTADHQTILCAVPLCHPKHLKGVEYTVEFCPDDRAKVSVGDVKILIDFANRKCSNNKGLQAYGSDEWGQDISTGWVED